MSRKKKESETSNFSEEFLSSKARIFLLLKISFVVFFLFSLVTIIVETYPTYQHKQYYKEKRMLTFSLEKEMRNELHAFYEQKWYAEHDTNIHVIKAIQQRIVEREIGDSVKTDETECSIVSFNKQKCKPIKKWVTLGIVLDTIYDTTYTTPWKNAESRKWDMDRVIDQNVFHHCDSLASIAIPEPNTFFKPSKFDSTPAAMFSTVAIFIGSFFFYCLFVFLKLRIYQFTQKSKSSSISDIGESLFTDFGEIGIGIKHNIISCLMGFFCALFWSLFLFH